MRKSVSKYSLEERLMIIKEYETSSLTALELAKKYGLHSRSIIAVWRNRYANSKKSINFAPENDTSVVEETRMVDKSKAELEAELAKVKKELEWSRLETKALEVLIEVAEKQGINIRKKAGAKQ